MATLEEATKQLQQLAHTQRQMHQLLQSMDRKNEATQTFIFDLTDYTQSLTLMTDLIPEEATAEPITVSEIGTVVSQQRELLMTLKGLLAEYLQTTPQPPLWFQQTNGGLRRIVASIDGILEMNGYLLKDNHAFQQEYPMAEQQVAPRKESFFKKLFKK